MKGDFSRDTYERRHHFSRVLMQQGRVQLDADWNEQAAIVLHYLRTLAADVIGPQGASIDDAGFEITTDVTVLTDEERARLKLKDATALPAGEFLIGKGHYFVDGILCESPEIVTFTRQHDYVVIDDDKPEPSGTYLAYLDVWERHVTAIDHRHMREVALGGPDTATRAQVLSQVKLLPIDDDLDFEKLTPDAVANHAPPYTVEEQRLLLELAVMASYHALKGKKRADRLKAIDTRIKPLKAALDALGHGRLRARAHVSKPSLDPCNIQPDARYRGAENQLYRVEVHRAGLASSAAGPTRATAATFKWSRENGCVVFPIQEVAENVVTLAHLGRDERFGLEVGDWVEVVDDEYALRNRAEPLLRVKKIEHLKVTLEGTPVAEHKAHTHRLLRRWDQKSGPLPLSDGASLIVEGAGDDDGWLTLEDGVQVQFQPASASGKPHFYSTGDYWLIPARVATGDVEWPGPSDDPRPRPPRGVRHHYASLAAVTVDAEGKVKQVVDLRETFDPLA